nr:MAG TPA: nucleotidase 5'-nucleotidase [Caudoviricetes sp.]
MMKMTTINFDMDGTIADLYGVENWLDDLIASNPRPYEVAKPLLNLSALARRLNALQRQGYRIAIISWLSKSGTAEYNKAVTKAKIDWLTTHLASVRFDEIHIVEYGTPKQNFLHETTDILFDDEEKNRLAWTGNAYDVGNILEVLREL